MSELADAANFVVRSLESMSEIMSPSSSCHRLHGENLLHLKRFPPDVVLRSSSDDTMFVEFYSVKNPEVF